ncbi:MAG TPA: hemolysin family protein [Thermoanaerobaculia bacterium]|nr:hemolysin family protein [Thermoanaerobaculia bacterium]
MTVLLLAAAGPPGLGLAIDPWLGLLLGLLLVLLNGFFVAAEFALVKVRPTQIEPLAETGSRRGRILQHMLEHLDAYLSATQLGITLASLALGWIGEPAFAWLLEPLVSRIPGATPALLHTVSLTSAFALITILHIVLGELAPKSLAIRHAKPTALWIALPLYGFFKLTYPAIWLLNHAANWLLRLVGVAPVTEGEMAHSEEELRLLLASTTDEISQQKRELLDNIFGMSERVARQIMVPRGDVVSLSTSRSMEDNLELARTSGHTRFPLCRGSLDEAVGLIHIKDLFRQRQPTGSLEEIARPLTFVPESLSLERLLRRMRTERVHLAAVLDEYGGVSGIVTLENVIEEIVGEIQDEFDAEKPELVAKGNGCFEVDGRMLVDEVEEALGIEFSERDEDTIAGVVLSELGRRPRLGDSVEVGPLRLVVREAEGNRIKSLAVEILTPAAVPEREERD